VLAESKGRSLDGGPWQTRYNAASAAWRRMLDTPQETYRCGISALLEVVSALSSNSPALPFLRGEKPGSNGTSLADLVNISQKYDLNLLAVQADDEQDPVAPSLVHYQLGHFAALLQRDGNRYLVSDPVFRKPRWVKKNVILAESSGRYLIPASLS